MYGVQFTGYTLDMILKIVLYTVYCLHYTDREKNVMCHMSCVTCHVSGLTCHLIKKYKKVDKVVELVGGGSVINRAYPVYFQRIGPWPILS